MPWLPLLSLHHSLFSSRAVESFAKYWRLGWSPLLSALNSQHFHFHNCPVVPKPVTKKETLSTWSYRAGGLSQSHYQLTSLRKSMYMCANFSVSRFDSLSDGWVGTISRSFMKASFKLCVLCLSRTFAEKHHKVKIWLDNKEFLRFIHHLCF